MFRSCFGVENLDIERLQVEYLDVKMNARHNPTAVEQDHIDRFLAELVPIEGLDLEVEGIVDRIYGIQRRFHRSLEAVLAEHGLTVQEWQVLSKLRNKGVPCESSPGELADQLDLSSGAMTNRLDRMERSGLVRRKPDPEDRRGVVVELTEDGRRAYESATGMQARREAFFASALSRTEQEQLNGLLRKLMLALERLEARPAVVPAEAAANGAVPSKAS
jgi:DNA-binding MarR family transcriptional regulator